jgi:hypothetical protein
MIILKSILKKRLKEIIDFYYEDDTELINPLCGYSTVFNLLPLSRKK